jgi:hypothetical protein
MVPFSYGAVRTAPSLRPDAYPLIQRLLIRPRLIVGIHADFPTIAFQN